MNSLCSMYTTWEGSGGSEQSQYCHQHTPEVPVCTSACCVNCACCAWGQGILNQASKKPDTAEYLNIYPLSEAGMLMRKLWQRGLCREKHSLVGAERQMVCFCLCLHMLLGRKCMSSAYCLSTGITSDVQPEHLTWTWWCMMCILLTGRSSLHIHLLFIYISQ